MYPGYNTLRILQDKQQQMYESEYLLMIYSSVYLDDSGDLLKILIFCATFLPANGFSNQLEHQHETTCTSSA
jgi:hypothetical protein